MNVNVHIDRLVLHDVDVPVGDQPALQAAVIAELQGLLASGGLSPQGARPGHISRLHGGGVEIGPEPSPMTLGRQIARAVYEGMNR